MLTTEEIEEILRGGRELRHAEFKGAGAATDSYFFAKVTRAVMSVGNLRDGGLVLIGIDDNDPASMGPGLDSATVADWLRPDEVAARMSVYADPPCQFEITAHTLSTGNQVIAVEVAEFYDVPHICVKAYEHGRDHVLRAGAVYVRPRKFPHTAEIATATDFRDLLDLATQKALRRLVATVESAGVQMTAPGPADADAFEREREEGWE